MCGALETVHHALNACHFHVPIFDSLEKCWEPFVHKGQTFNIRAIPDLLSFSHPLGVMVWVARSAHWSLRNSLAQGGVPAFDSFLTIWGKMVHVVSQWEPLSKFGEVFTLFHTSLMHLLNHGSLIVLCISYQGIFSNEVRAQKKQKKMSCKHELAIEVKELICGREGEGYTMVYTDGSAEQVSGVGWIGGWGCHSVDGWEKSSYLPPHLNQTINRTELQAVIETVLHHHDYQSKLAICTDSAYVFGGVEQTALRWRAAGWVTAQGPVTIVDLLIQLVTLLDTCCPVLEWIKVHSHIDIPGNDRADALAERGRKASPLYLNARHPPVHPCTPLGSPLLREEREGGSPMVGSQLN